MTSMLSSFRNSLRISRWSSSSSTTSAIGGVVILISVVRSLSLCPDKGSDQSNVPRRNRANPHVVEGGGRSKGPNAGQPADICLFVAGTAHVDAAQSVAADLARRAEREVEHPAASERAAVLHRTFDLL